MPKATQWPTRLLYRFDPLVLALRDKSWLVDMRYVCKPNSTQAYLVITQTSPKPSPPPSTLPAGSTRRCGVLQRRCMQCLSTVAELSGHGCMTTRQGATSQSMVLGLPITCHTPASVRGRGRGRHLTALACSLTLTSPPTSWRLACTAPSLLAIAQARHRRGST